MASRSSSLVMVAVMAFPRLVVFLSFSGDRERGELMPKQRPNWPFSRSFWPGRGSFLR